MSFRRRFRQIQDVAMSNIIIIDGWDEHRSVKKMATLHDLFIYSYEYPISSISVFKQKYIILTLHEPFSFLPRVKPIELHSSNFPYLLGILASNNINIPEFDRLQNRYGNSNYIASKDTTIEQAKEIVLTFLHDHQSIGNFTIKPKEDLDKYRILL